MTGSTTFIQITATADRKRSAMEKASCSIGPFSICGYFDASATASPTWHGHPETD
jgi:hypothetical protein